MRGCVNPACHDSAPDLEGDEHGEDEEAEERREDLKGGEAEPPQ